MRHVGHWLLFLLILTFSGAAAAQAAPVMCTGSNASAFKSAKLLGPSLVRQAWNNYADGCDDIEGFAELIATTFHKATPAAPSRAAQCRYAGWVEGAIEYVDELFVSCADSCLADGQFVGALVAAAYCELSIALGGLGTADAFIRGPVEVCGLSYEVGCDENFINKTVGFPGGACKPFTVAPFTAVYQQTQFNQCAYDPIDPDDP